VLALLPPSAPLAAPKRTRRRVDGQSAELQRLLAEVLKDSEEARASVLDNTSRLYRVHPERRMHQLISSPNGSVLAPEFCDLTDAPLGEPTSSSEGSPQESIASFADDTFNAPASAMDSSQAHVSVYNDADTHYMVVELTCKDRYALLFDTVCTITDAGCVSHRLVPSPSERIFVCNMRTS
jgi:hypothetical protein